MCVVSYFSLKNFMLLCFKLSEQRKLLPHDLHMHTSLGIGNNRKWKSGSSFLLTFINCFSSLLGFDWKRGRTELDLSKLVTSCSSVLSPYPVLGERNNLPATAANVLVTVETEKVWTIPASCPLLHAGCSLLKHASHMSAEECISQTQWAAWGCPSEACIWPWSRIGF